MASFFLDFDIADMGKKNTGMLGCSSFPQVMEGARAGDLGRALQRAKQVALRAAVGW